MLLLVLIGEHNFYRILLQFRSLFFSHHVYARKMELENPVVDVLIKYFLESYSHRNLVRNNRVKYRVNRPRGI